MPRGKGFKRRLPPARPSRVALGARTLTAAIRRGTYAAPAPAAPVPKVVPVESEKYRRLVALLPCKVCGIDGYSQAAHPNTDKGAGTKTDDRLCFPLCCDRPGVRGCHLRFDQHALMTKAARRLIEPAWGADTRRQIEALGLWPANLPRWAEPETGDLP